ncbi:MAG: hypothetical protein NDI82_05630 [Anaeromyxobacteraceae bacterium]|nr:hypothetical protein [Anaeromyxobacteraceae bacterium]
MGHTRGLLPGCLLVLACAAAGCRDAKPKPNPHIGTLTVLTPAAEVQSAHRLTVEVELLTDHAVEAVGVAYRAFPRADYDAHAPDIVSWVLGSSAHDAAVAGGRFIDELEVPADVPAGDYYLVPEVDPLRTIDESDEQDQLGAPVPFSVLDERRDQVRLVLSSAALDTPTFELSFVTTATPPEPLGLSLIVEAEAMAPVESVALSACLRPPGGDCSAMPLGIWDRSGGEPRYLDRLPLPALAPGDPTAVHLDLRLDPALEPALDAVAGAVAQACLASVPTCAMNHGLLESSVEECLAAVSPDPAHTDLAGLKACLLKLVPFMVEATAEVTDPAVVLWDPPVAPGRSTSVRLQLLAPRPVTPVVPAPLVIRPLAAPMLAQHGGDVPRCSPASLDLVVDKGACPEPVSWTVRTLPGWTPAWPVGTVTATEFGATYTPYEMPLIDGAGQVWAYGSCAPPDRSPGVNKLLVEATACGQSAALEVTEQNGGGAIVYPAEVEVTPGAPGTVEFRANFDDCLAAAVDTDWSLVDSGFGTALGDLEPTGDRLVTRWRPPAGIAGGSATVTLRAHSAGCSLTSDATLRLSIPRTLAFEKSYVKWLGGDLFGAGVDLYGGAFVDAAGARASAHAIVPLTVFGADVRLFAATDAATVDPRAGGASAFHHNIDVFGYSVNRLDCPGDEACGGTWNPWSESKCVPEGKPPVCVGAAYARACKTTTDCAGLPGLSCKNKLCTKKCDEPSDCTGGACEGAIQPGPYKRTFVIVVVPVTVEGKVCAEVGIQAQLNLLTPVPNQLGLQVGPYFEVSGYASAAIGYTGILAVGVRGELVLVRDDFSGGASATLEVVSGGQLGCVLPEGCIQGTLRESVGNVLQGGQGQVYLFADYPTLRWCGWYPCFGTARAKKTLAAWGPLFEVENRCDFCTAGADCPVGVACVDGECLDGGRGILCREQRYFMSEARPALAR